MPPASSQRRLSTPRHPGFESLRAAAIVFVVILHACVPYAPTAMVGLAWPVRHPQPAPVIDLVFWGIAGAIMPLFFWMSGYFASQSLRLRSPQEFWQSRVDRLVVPGLVFAAILLPLELYVWLIGWALDGQIPWVKLRSLKLGPLGQELWGLSHLWYLQYVALLSLGLLLWDRWTGREDPGTAEMGTDDALRSDRERSRFIDRASLLALWNSPLRVATVAVAALLVIAWEPRVLAGFQHRVEPVPSKFALSLVFFASGVITQRTGSQPVSRGWPGLIAAICGLPFLLPLIHAFSVDPSGINPSTRWTLAAALGGYAAVMTTSAWDWATHCRGRLSQTARFLAQASFWIYLVHHPLVAMGHIGLRPLAWPAELQALLTASGTLVICLASYRWLVQGSAIERLLEGERRPLTAASISVLTAAGALPSEPSVQQPRRRAA